MSCAEVGYISLEFLEVIYQRGNCLRFTAAHEVDGLLSKRIRIGDEIGQEDRLCSVVEVYRRRIFGGNGEKPLMPPCVAISARLVSPWMISMMSRMLSVLACPASGLMLGSL